MVNLRFLFRMCVLFSLCGNAFALPTVNISEADSEAAEAGQDTASFTVTRTDDGTLGQNLNVYFDFVNPPTGTDYDFGAGLGYVDGDTRYITIPAGESSASVTITPRLDNLIEGTNTGDHAGVTKYIYPG